MIVSDVLGTLLSLLGSLGLFLFGMKLMSEALLKVTGNRLRNVLTALTNKSGKGILSGLILTSGIQSSSATTVMVVSFVNAGLLSLTAATGLVMGANIGTTVTGWLVTLIGLQKFSIASITLPLIGLAFPLYFSKKSTVKFWGEFIFGFSILFIGLNFLKDSLPVIAEQHDFLQNLLSFAQESFFSPVLFFIIGILITIAIQSSSATMALTLVMCTNGWLGYDMAALMILGENVGTTITANIAATVANRNAKRIARIHFLINLIGSVWMLFLYSYVLQGIDAFMVAIGQAEASSNLIYFPIGLSLFHTSFNIANTILLVGFIPFLIRLSDKMVDWKRSEDNIEDLKHIDSTLLSTSELSILQARKEIWSFGKDTSANFKLIPKLLLEKNTTKYEVLLQNIIKFEKDSDKREEEIAIYLTKISESELSNQGSSRVRAMLKIIDELESITDCQLQMAINIDQKNKNKLWYTQDLRDNLSLLFAEVFKAFDVLCQNLENDYQQSDLGAAEAVENTINAVRDRLMDEYYDSSIQKEYPYKAGVSYNDLLRLSEKIGDHIFNIQKAIQESKKN